MDKQGKVTVKGFSLQRQTFGHGEFGFAIHTNIDGLEPYDNMDEKKMQKAVDDLNGSLLEDVGGLKNIVGVFQLPCSEATEGKWVPNAAGDSILWTKKDAEMFIKGLGSRYVIRPIILKTPKL